MPQGLSCSGPYFNAWLTRIYRKYNIVVDQTWYALIHACRGGIQGAQRSESFNQKLATIRSEDESVKAELSSCGAACYQRSNIYG
jgi:hypothetical protein